MERIPEQDIEHEKQPKEEYLKVGKSNIQARWRKQDHDFSLSCLWWVELKGNSRILESPSREKDRRELGAGGEGDRVDVEEFNTK